MNILRIVLAVPLLFFGLAAGANTINYSVDDLGGGRWQYNYDVDNTGLDVIDNIVVYFDLGLYENLSVAASPADWDSIVFDPDPGIPDDGLLDSLADVAGIDPGAMLGGFSVAFDFLGAGTPGDQFFELYDFFGDFIGDGFTTLVDTPPPQPTPEPQVFALLMLGLALLGLGPARRRSLTGKASKA